MKPLSNLVIGIVGPCTSGKSTLKKKLEELGYEVHHIAQEHSYVPDMWKKITNPDILIYLNVSYETTLIRRNLNWHREEYDIQGYRLRHAFKHANLHINTDALNPEEVLRSVLLFLQKGDD